MGVVMALVACAAPATPSPEETAVSALVEEFGKKLQSVSLLSPTAAADIRTHYSPCVAADLLNYWTGDPAQAPGRTVSSPWPDRIEITGLTKTGPDTYSVTGYVIEVTSVEAISGGAAKEIPVRLTVQNSGGHWLISEYAQGKRSP